MDKNGEATNSTIRNARPKNGARQRVVVAPQADARHCIFTPFQVRSRSPCVVQMRKQATFPLFTAIHALGGSTLFCSLRSHESRVLLDAQQYSGYARTPCSVDLDCCGSLVVPIVLCLKLEPEERSANSWELSRIIPSEHSAVMPKALFATPPPRALLLGWAWALLPRMPFLVPPQVSLFSW